MNEKWYLKTIPETFEIFHSGEQGLSNNEVKINLEKYGYNKLPEVKPDSLAIIFLHQFQSPLIYILIVASLIVFVMGETIDGIVILIVLLFNAVVGAIQEGKAQNTLIALKKFTETDATVLRDNREIVIPDHEIVPGDIILLQEGEKIPADARIISANSLRVNEAALTGESEPSNKISDTLLDKDLSLPDQKNIIFKGTNIVAGNGKAIVISTGIDTFIGHISKKILVIDTEIPLKKNIRDLSRIIIIIIGLISILLFTVGIIRGKSAIEMFATVVSLSVSLIPEGLPIVITLVLATGVWRMSKRNALVKRLQAVEALGQTNVILVDKTGTITKNEMVIQKIYLPSQIDAGGKFFEIGGIGYEPKGTIQFDGKDIDPMNHHELLFAGKISAFCANARVAFIEEIQQWKAFGDPTEAALLVFAKKLGFHKDILEQESPQTAEIPFDYKNKYHATVHKVDEKEILVVIGASEKILNISDKIWKCKGPEHFTVTDEKLSKDELDNIETTVSELSGQGLRVLGIAISYDVPKNLTPENIKNLTFVGLVGMKDALRSEVKEALEQSHSAGIRVVMITGDHKKTAEVIGKEAGIWKEGDEILTGEDINLLSEEALSKKLGKVSIFARVTPEHKFKIVNAYKIRKDIVAMTGDGVNDALSLVAADLGVAMGKSGTEVAKEASDIVLLDDNFGSIVSAVEEGRNIYKTIQKVILYLFSTSIGEALTILGTISLGYPLPLLPAQIIWLNFVTDGFLDVALAMEPKEDGLLRGNFKKPGKYLVDRLMIKRMILMSIPMMIGTIILFREFFAVDITKAWTISLTTLAVFQWFNAWNCRHESKSIFQISPFSNKFLIGATMIVVSLQMFMVYNPVMQSFFKTSPLTLYEWFIIVSIATSILFVEETRKFIYRKKLRLNLQ